MDESFDSPRQVYRRVATEIDHILVRLAETSNDAKVADAQANAKRVLDEFRPTIDLAIAQLEKDVEWDTFTIALYGETNAGKSTVIETLRILLGEQTKKQSRAEFQRLMTEIGGEDELERLRVSLSMTKSEAGALRDEGNRLQVSQATEEETLRDDFRRLQEAIGGAKASASIWQKLLSVFRKLPEELQATVVSRRIEELLAAHRAASEQVDARRRNAEGRVAELTAQIEASERSLSELAEFADGGIIGNGRSDFTLRTQKYEFNVAGQRYALLDVPGIEGKEDRVIDEIGAAVRSAHAVFYVTAKAAPPQKGDGARKGTLEKIAEHLGAQTEVWTLFNKRVTNPVQLSKAELSTSDEMESLADLDEKIGAQLGNHYRGVITLSAYPAFLAVADCLLPGRSETANRRKFLTKYDADTLVARSGFAQLLNLIEGPLASDHAAKIKRSNFNKAREVVDSAKTNVGATRDSFNALGQQLAKDAKGSCKKLDGAFEVLKDQLLSQAEDAADGFERSVRKAVYDIIATGVSNERFKSAFADRLQQGKLELEKDLSDGVKTEVEKFRAEIQGILERHQEFTTDLLRTYADLGSGLSGQALHFKLKLDSGVDVIALIGSAIGIAAMFWNPASLVVLIPSAITAAIGVVKGVWGLVSTDYKKSQQRKTAASNLSDIKFKIKRSLRGSLEEGFPALEEKIEELKLGMIQSAENVSGLNQVLAHSVYELKKLSESINKAGERA
jgi:hypothetical protein